MAGLTENYSRLKNAARIGDLEELKKFIPDESGINPIGEFFRIACEFGHLDIVKYLFNIQLGPGEYISSSSNALDLGFYRASINGHIHIVKFLIEYVKTFKKILLFTIQTTASQGHFEIIKILISNNFPFGQHTVSNSINSGNYKLTKYLICKANVTQKISEDNVEKFKEIKDELDLEISEILGIGQDVYSIISTLI